MRQHLTIDASFASIINRALLPLPLVGEGWGEGGGYAASVIY